jgi:2-amino-4-hydroxy-6-hydroxymethyldihydropteridine diphosphokinase
MASSKNMILVGLGSNLPFAGRKSAEITLAAIKVLEKIFDGVVASRLFVSPAWPDPSDPPFINAAVRAETSLRPNAILAALLAVEAGFGRRRRKPNAPRTLDLDLLDFLGAVEPGSAEKAVLPHPRLHLRDFVLAPVAEIAPEWRFGPGRHSAGEMLTRLPSAAARAWTP